MYKTEVFALNNICDFEYFNIPAFESKGNIFTFFLLEMAVLVEGIIAV